MSLRPNQAVGPFRLAEIIGVGGMGEVWRAHHHRNGTAVAIKVITSDRAAEPKYRQSFLREVQAVAALNHPGVVAIYDYGELESSGSSVSQPWYAMEIAQTSLAQISLGDYRTLRRILVEILDALAHAHARGVIHRDLKPENILLTADQSVKLTDFGMAHIVEFSDDTGRVFGPGGGTPDFMAPEQFRGQWRRFGPWTDLYAIGCVAWELASGAPPFLGPNVVDIGIQHMSDPLPALAGLFEMPERFEVWLRRLIKKHPLDRYRRAADAQWALVHDVGFLDEDDASARTSLRSRPGTPTTASTLPFDQFDSSAAPPREDTLDDMSVSMTLQMTYGLTPPFPETWRTDHVPSRLGGAGLGLFGIREIPFLGREQEREFVWDRLRAVDEQGHNEVLLIDGDPGVGRTRFGQWISRRAHELGAATVVRATHGPIPNRGDGLAGAVTRFLGIDGADKARAEEIVFDRLGPAFDASLLFDLLFHSKRDDGTGTSTFAAPAQRFAAVEQLFRQLSWERPVIFFADDLQWGADTLLFLQHLLESRTRTLVIGTLRNDALVDRYWESELLGELKSNRLVSSTRLQPLSDTERRGLVDQMLDLAEGLGERVAERTQGIPLFAVQLVGDWVQRGLLEESETGFRLASGTQLQLPDDIFALWKQRIDELATSIGTSNVLQMLEVAALLGRSSDGEWERVCSAIGLDVPEGLEQQLVARRLATSDTAGWSFQHGMLREALERSAVESQRAHRIYRAAAAEADPTDPYRRARFQIRAGQYDDAVESMFAALKIAIHTTAIDHSLQLVEVVRQLLAELRADASDSRRGQIREAHVALVRMSGEFVHAKSLASKLVADAERHGWRRVAADTHLHLGILGQLTSEKTLRVLLHFDEALAIFDELNDDRGRARAYRALAHYHIVSGRPAIASNLTKKALGIRERYQDLEGVAECLAALGASTLSQGDLDEACDWYTRARKTARQQGLRHYLAEALDGLGQIAQRDEQFSTAESLFIEARDVWTSIGNQARFRAAAHLGLLRVQRGAFGAAQKTLSDIEDEVRSGEALQVSHLVDSGLMACAAYFEDHDRFDRLAEELGVRVMRAAARDVVAPETLVIAGELWSGRGDRRRARRAYDIARNQFLALGAQQRADDVARSIGRL